MFYMSMSDLMISMILQQLMAYTSANGDENCTVHDVIGQCLASSLCEFSGLMMMMIAVDRYRMKNVESWARA